MDDARPLVASLARYFNKGLFSDIPTLKSCNLSRNRIRALPDDMAALRCGGVGGSRSGTHRWLAGTTRPTGVLPHRELEALVLHHNCLAELPPGLFCLSGLRSLDLSYNHLAWLDRAIGGMDGLQVCGGGTRACRSHEQRLAC